MKTVKLNVDHGYRFIKLNSARNGCSESHVSFFLSHIDKKGNEINDHGYENGWIDYTFSGNCQISVITYFYLLISRLRLIKTHHSIKNPLHELFFDICFKSREFPVKTQILFDIRRDGELPSQLNEFFPREIFPRVIENPYTSSNNSEMLMVLISAKDYLNNTQYK